MPPTKRTTPAAEPEQPTPAAADEPTPAPEPDRPPARNLDEALARVQANLPHVHKGKTATVPGKEGRSGYSYKYADLADIAPAIHPLLAREGLAFRSKPTMNENNQFVLVYKLTHGVSGEVEEGIYPLPNPLSATPQMIGSAITYARRYTLCCVTGVVPDEDEDGQIASEQPAAGAPQQQPQGPPLPPAGEVRAALDPVLVESDPQKKIDLLKAVWDKYGGIEVLRHVKLAFEDGDEWASDFIGAQVKTAKVALAQQQSEGSQDPERPAPAQQPQTAAEGGPQTPHLDAAIEAAQVGGGPREIMQAAMDAHPGQTTIPPEVQHRAQQESARALGEPQRPEPPAAAAASPGDRMREAYVAEIRDLHVPILGVEAGEYLAPLLTEARVQRVREAPPSVVRAWTLKQRKGLVAPRLAADGKRDAAQRLAGLPAEQAATTDTVFVEDPPF